MVRFHLLGTVDLRDSDGKELRSVIAQPKRLALLTYLVVAAPHGFHRRDRLLALFWPESDSEHARNSLRQSLHFLRRAFGEAVVIGRGEDEVGIAPGTVWCDVVEFEAAIARKDNRAATGLYRGELLPGFFVADAPELERWLEEQRQRLTEACAQALEGVAEEAMARGEFPLAVEHLRRRAAFAPLNSRVALRLMTALAAAGERAGAIAHAQQHGDLLRAELGASNDPSIARLADQLRFSATTEGPSWSERPGIGALESPPPADRTAETPAAAIVTTRSSAVRGPERRAWGLTAILVAPAFALAATIFALALAPPYRRPPTIGVVVAAVDGRDEARTAEAAHALRVALGTQGRLFVIDDSTTAETRDLMRLARDIPLTVPLAAQLAIRRGVPYVATGSVIAADGGMRLTVQLIDAMTSTPLRTVSSLVPVEGSLSATAVRLTDSLAAHVARHPPDSVPRPLPDVTTRSLEALRTYDRARRIRIPDTEAAMRFAEAAIGEDSSFAMAHYFVGELAWFSDQQTKSEYHFTRAFELSHDLPARERLLIATRYFYIARDWPDSALIYATRLLGTAPHDALAFEAVAWMYRAFGWHAYAGALADTALSLDSSSYGAISTRSASYIDVGDTVGAMAFAHRIAHLFSPAEEGARGAAALLRGDWTSELKSIDSLYPRTAPGQNNYTLGAAPGRHLILIGLGRVTEASAVLSDIRVGSTTQNLPRALLLQARAEVDAGSPQQARALVAEAMAWVAANNLSPPAIARLVERAADVLARAGDTRGIEALQRVVRERDNGRRSHSFALAHATLTGASAYARGDMERAAAELQRSRQQMGYLGRPHATLALLEADARAAAGDHERADLLYRDVIAPAMGRGDLSTWAALMRPAADRALRRKGAVP